MKLQSILAFVLAVYILSFSSCCICRHNPVKSSNMNQISSPQAIIYKTRKDYSKLVPVILTEDQKSIASFPDVKDIYTKGTLAYPTQLHKGFLLDNRGISQNVAFIKLTYEQYAALSQTPSADELMKMLVDKNPLKRMYACGQRGKFANLTEELNVLIDKDDFSGFTRLR